MFRVFNRSGRAGRLWFSLFRMAGGGSSMLEFCGEWGLVWLLSMSLNISHRMYRKGLKIKLNFFSPLKQNGGEKKTTFFLSDRCIARPLIYVDVSLHSNKKPEKYQHLCVCWMFLKDAVSPSFSCQSQACVGGLLCGSRSWVASKHLKLLVFMCGPICFLATKHPSTLLPADRLRCFRFTSLSKQKKGWLWLENKRGRTPRGRLNTMAT